MVWKEVAVQTYSSKEHNENAVLDVGYGIAKIEEGERNYQGNGTVRE